MLKHPRELGFALGLRIRIAEPASITESTAAASTVRDVVYVALFTEETGRLEKGDALKIGETNKTLMSRWKPVVGIFGRATLRNNEKDDRRKWLKFTSGKEISVWMKPAGKVEIPYAKGLTRTLFSTRCAEEEFLDQYYQPKLGVALTVRLNDHPVTANRTSR
jgi:hypothetical protein